MTFMHQCPPGYECRTCKTQRIKGLMAARDFSNESRRIITKLPCYGTSEGLTEQDIKFEQWLRATCFQKPTREAYELAKAAWKGNK